MILDGIGDEECKVLGGRTPLGAAETPNLDAIAKKAKIEHCYTVREGYVPESDAGVVSLLGYDIIYESRGSLEALGLGIKLRNGDLAFRCNFATIDDLEKGNVLDRRAGRNLTTKEARILAKAINREVKLPFKFEFYPSVQHRGVLVIRGGFSDNISKVDVNSRGKLEFSEPFDDEEDSKLSANLINLFVRKSHEVLDRHPVNLKRAKKGLYSANVLLCRGAGSSVPRFKKLKGKWIALGYMPLEIGIARAVGMDVYKIKYPKLKGIDAYANLYDGLNKSIKGAVKMLRRYKKKYDYFYIHFKATDLPGHDGRPKDKVKMIEILDKKFFSFLRGFIGDCKLIVTGDHSTPCNKKAHSADPVPVLIFDGAGHRFEKGSGRARDAGDGEGRRFTEKNGLMGRKWLGRDLLEGAFF